MYKYVTVDRTYSVGSRLSRTGPGWRSNIRGDYTHGQDTRPITTKDLICWAYQVINIYIQTIPTDRTHGPSQPRTSSAGPIR